MSLVWTTERPTEAGWYWVESRIFDGPKIGKFAGRSASVQVGRRLLHKDWITRWAGPIPQPTEPADQDNSEGEG